MEEKEESGVRRMSLHGAQLLWLQLSVDETMDKQWKDGVRIQRTESAASATASEEGVSLCIQVMRSIKRKPTTDERHERLLINCSAPPIATTPSTLRHSHASATDASFVPTASAAAAVAF